MLLVALTALVGATFAVGSIAGASGDGGAIARTHAVASHQLPAAPDSQLRDVHGSSTPARLSNDLEDAIRQHETGWQSNQAMKTMIDDYTEYHVVLVITGGALVVGLALLSIFLWVRLKRTPRAGAKRWSPERKLYLLGALASTAVGLLMGLVVAANAATSVDPVRGFLLAAAHPTPNGGAVDAAVIDWVNSGTGPVPSIVQDQVRDRLAWQQPKAIICGVLFVLFATLAVKLWRTLVRRLQTGKSQPTQRYRALFIAECATVFAALLMIVMAIANTQASVAPLALTILGGS
jgi:hypothetical protein